MKMVDPAASSASAASPGPVRGGLRTHGLILLGIVLLAALVYLPLFQANYCGFDDTLELPRLSFHDPGTIANDMRTVLFDSLKYRPFMMTLNRITFEAGHRAAAFFRARNIVSHLLSTMVVYGIGWLLFESIPVAAAAALLFSIHPLANQAVAGAVWVLTPADFCLFLAFFLLLVSLRSTRYRYPALIGSLLLGSLGVLIYDPVIFLYGLIPLYLGTWMVIERKLLPIRYLATLAGIAIAFLAVWFSLRAAFLPHRNPQVTPFATVMVNGMIYVAGVFQAFDPILATDTLGTPLPREALTGQNGLTLDWLALILLPGIIMIGVLFATMSRWRRNLTRKDYLLFACLLIAWGGSLVPYLFFSTHPSETYNYVGLPLLLLIATRILYAIVTPVKGERKPNLAVFGTVVGVMAVLYGTATVDRNFRVKSCGNTLGNILRELPTAQLRQGKWNVLFANVPNEPQSRIYGMYGYKGVDTLGMGEYGAPGVPGAVQFASGNPDLTAESLTPEEFSRRCSVPQPDRMCFWVHANGDLDRPGPGAVAPPAR